MIERLLEVVQALGQLIAPCVVIDEYEEGVLLRFGRRKRTLKAGLHWKMPFAEVVLTDRVVPRTVNLKTQTLITADRRQINISAIVTARIQNIEKACLGVEDADAALADACYGAIGAAVAASTWDQVTGPDFAETVRKAGQKQAVTFGWSVERLYVDNLCEAKAFRVFGIGE